MQTERHSKDEILSEMHPIIREWFESRFQDVTEPQAYAIPLIHHRKSVLVSSPTGSGKTITAFLSIINNLFEMGEKGKLEDRIYCVYVSPLKALGNDIHRNLEEPLNEIYALAKQKGMDVPRIRTAIRSGDTTQSERQKMARKPPHILITTPESLSLVLTSPKFRERFRDVKYVIVDEIHEISGSKRGSMLSLNLERLQHLSGPLVRIGLSATQAPIEEIAKFLGGFSGGRPRKVQIVEIKRVREMDLEVLAPVEDLNSVPFEIARERAYDMIAEMIEEHRTTIVFTNTRSSTEQVAFKLKERGIDSIEAHHGSMSKERRLDVEEKLKRGELKAVVTSTSLELGIDIGYVDLVVQIGSPKSIAKGLQRIGRSGHAIGAVPKGRFIAFQNDDLVECAVLVKSAYDGKIDRVDIPRNPLDVLAQTIVGMSLEERWDVDEALELVRRSYAFHTLRKDDFISVLHYLAGKSEDFYSKIWYDEEEGIFGKKKGSRMIYFLNSGTIPEDSNYKVINDNGAPLGKLSEKFVERLAPGDIFVLGGRTYEFVRVRGMRVHVKDARGKSPTVPSWAGEMLPRSFDLSVEIGRFRERMSEQVEDEDRALRTLMEEYHLSRWAANSVMRYFQEQKMACGIVPTERRLLVEEYRGDGKWHYIFHYAFGRRVNDALSRAISYRISRKEGFSAGITVNDDSFMVSTPRRVNPLDLARMIRSDSIERGLREAIRDTEMFAQRFRHVATRSFAVLRNYRGKDISVGRQRRRAERVMRYLSDYEDFPVVRETYSEIFNMAMDLPHAREVLSWIEEGRAELHAITSEIPSPFAQNILLRGMSDIVSMEDKSAILREFQRKLLEKILPEEELKAFLFEPEQVREYFASKFRIRKKSDILSVMRRLGAMNVLSQRSRNIYRYCRDMDACRDMAEELIEEGKICSAWVGEVLWVPCEELGDYAEVYASSSGIMDEMAMAIAKDLKDKDMRMADLVNRFGARARDLIRELERSYIVGRRLRNGEVVYHLRDVPPSSEKRERLIERFVYRYLEGNAPATLGEIAYGLHLEEEDVEKALESIIKEGFVEKGRFILGEEDQYMLSRDVNALKTGMGAVGPEQVRAYRLKRYFSLKGIDDYFDLFGEASRTYDIFYHVENFDWDDWRNRRERNDILMGKFVRGKVKYVRREDAPVFVGAFRDVELSDMDEKVLDIIRRHDGISMKEVAEIMGIPEAVKRSIERLDAGMYIVRKYLYGEGWQSRNLFIASEVEPMPMEQARKELVRRFIRAYGPVPMRGIYGYTGFDRREIRKYISELIEEGEVAEIEVRGEADENYMAAEDIASLQESSMPEDDVRILSLFDPYIAPMWSEIVSRYGERWIYPVIKNGSLDGYAEIWPMSGRVEVRELEAGDIRGALRALKKVRDYYAAEGIDVLTVNSVNQGPIEDEGPFVEEGYVRIQDMMVLGNVVPDVMPQDEAIKLMLHRQGVCDRRFYDALHLIEERGWIRSDYDAFLRVRNYRPLNRYSDRLVLCKTIPSLTSYTTPQICALYQMAKGRKPGEDESIVLQVIGQGRRKKDISQESPLGPASTKKALEWLYDASYVAKDMKGKYLRVFPRKYIKDARRQVIRMFLSTYGALSAEMLSSLTSGEYRMAEIREILKEMEDAGELVKGFLIEGDRTVYWIMPEFLKKLECKGDFVIPKDDPAGWYLEPIAKRELSFVPQVYVVRDGKITGALRGRKSGKRIFVEELIGGAVERYLIKDYARKWRIRLDFGVEQVKDWEIRESMENL